MSGREDDSGGYASGHSIRARAELKRKRYLSISNRQRLDRTAYGSVDAAFAKMTLLPDVPAQLISRLLGCAQDLSATRLRRSYWTPRRRASAPTRALLRWSCFVRTAIEPSRGNRAAKLHSERPSVARVIIEHPDALGRSRVQP